MTAGGIVNTSHTIEDKIFFNIMQRNIGQLLTAVWWLTPSSNQCLPQLALHWVLNDDREFDLIKI